VRSRFPFMQAVLTTLVVVALVAGTRGDDARVCAIRKQTIESLKLICQKASIEHDADADIETLRALVYKTMQGEIPGTSAVLPWPGPGEPGECDSFNSRADSAEKSRAASQQQQKPPPRGNEAAPDMSKMHEMIFKKLDMNHDGKLAHAEMKPMLDQVNAEARRKGEAEHDLFKTLDRDVDGFVSPEEAEGFFKQMAAGFGGGAGGGAKPAKAPSPEQDVAHMAAGLFSSLDKDKDDRLSKDEFQDIVEKHKAEMKAKGEEEESDFWTSLDANADGYIDRSEADTFLKQMLSALRSGEQNKDEV